MQAFRIVTLLACAFAASCSVTRSDKIDYAPEPGLVLSTPAASEAVVVFLRPAFAGHGNSAAVYDGDAFLSLVMADSHFVYRTTPGQHTFAVVSESADFLEADLAGGRIYFAKVDPRMGWWRTRFSLAAIAPGQEGWQDLPSWLAESYGITPNDKAVEWSANSRESVREKVDAELPDWRKKPDRPQLQPTDGVAAFPDAQRP